MVAAVGQGGHDRLSRPARLQIAAGVGEADHRVGVGDVDPLRIDQRIEGDPERPVQTLGEGLHLRGLASPVRGAQHDDAARLALGDEDVAIGRNPKQPRRLQLGERRHRETRQGLQLGASRPGHHRWQPETRLRRHVLRHVGEGDLTRHPRRVAPPIAVGGGAGDRGRNRRPGQSADNEKRGPSTHSSLRDVPTPPSLNAPLRRPATAPRQMLACAAQRPA